MRKTTFHLEIGKSRVNLNCSLSMNCFDNWISTGKRQEIKILKLEKTLAQIPVKLRWVD